MGSRIRKRGGRTCLALELEGEGLERRIDQDKTDVDEVAEGPPAQLGKLGRDEGSAHRADAVDGVHDTHFGRGVP